MAQRIRRLALATAAVAVILVGVLSVGARWVAAGNPCLHSYEIPPATVATTSRVAAKSCDFAPTVAYVPLGSIVTFVNDGSSSHLITGANGEWGSREVELQAGSTVDYQFERPGIYPYACSLHPGMSGAIVVGDVAASVPDSDPQAQEPELPAVTGTLMAGVGAMGLLLGAAGLWFATRRRRE